MSTEFTVVSWNVKDNLNDPQVQEAIIDTDLDIGVFPEASPEEIGVSSEASRNFQNAGYILFNHRYDDTDGRADRHTLAVTVKPELVDRFDVINVAGRNATRVALVGGGTFTGIHGDDRCEVTRITQIAALNNHCNAVSRDAIVAGDCNAMPGDALTARLLRTFRPIAARLPYKNPGEPQNNVQRVGSIARRLCDMADGTVMDMFALYGFEVADPERNPTMHKGPLHVQLDHILHRGNFVTVLPTVVEPANGLSDHDRIRAVIGRS